MMKVIVFSFLFLFSLSLFAKPADPVCTNTGQIPLGFENSEMWIEQTKALSIEAAKKDLKGFCEWNRMDRLTGGGLDPNTPSDLKDYRQNKDAGDRDAAAKLFSPLKLKEDTIWEASIYGHADLKKKYGRSRFHKLCGSVGSFNCADNMLKALARTDLKNTYKGLEYAPRGRIDVPSEQLLAGCAFLNPLHALGCKSASKDALDIVRLHTLENSAYRSEVTPVPLILETVQNPKSTGALQRVAMSLWKNIRDKKFANDENIFSELSTELQKDGFTAKEADKEALKVLGAIASGGPNFTTRIHGQQVNKFPDKCLEEECQLNAVYMAAIAEGMVHADTIKMENNAPGPYSLPKGSDFQCDSGKAYHFWATAALTDRLMDKGHSATNARSAVYLSHLGYHLKSASSDRLKNVLSVPRYGAVENGLRMDLNLAGAGVSFGARLRDVGGTEPIKMKEGFLQTLEEGSATPSSFERFDRSPTQVYDWLNRTAAKTAFEFYP